MNMKIEPELLDYMKKTGKKDILLYVKVGSSCCGGTFLMAKARFVKEKDGDLAAAGYETLETEVGKIYYQPEELHFDRNPQILINRFLGKVMLQVLDVYAADERFTRCKNMEG